MNTVMKKILTLAFYFLALSGSAYAADMTCANDNVQLDVYYNIGPRGSDIIDLTLADRTMVEFITKLSIKDISTRCGIASHQKAKLLKNNGQTQIEGQVSITIGATDCGFQHVGANLHLDYNQRDINEYLTCE